MSSLKDKKGMSKKMPTGVNAVAITFDRPSLLQLIQDRGGIHMYNIALLIRLSAKIDDHPFSGLVGRFTHGADAQRCMQKGSRAG